MGDVKRVAALKYKKEEGGAPQVVGTGTGEVAERILQLAKENNIPLYNDEKLVNQLLALELGNSIPPELYRAVADVLVFVYSMDKKYGK